MELEKLRKDLEDIGDELWYGFKEKVALVSHVEGLCD